MVKGVSCNFEPSEKWNVFVLSTGFLWCLMSEQEFRFNSKDRISNTAGFSSLMGYSFFYTEKFSLGKHFVLITHR